MYKLKQGMLLFGVVSCHHAHVGVLTMMCYNVAKLGTQVVTFGTGSVNGFVGVSPGSCINIWSKSGFQSFEEPAVGILWQDIHRFDTSVGSTFELTDELGTVQSRCVFGKEDVLSTKVPKNQPDVSVSSSPSVDEQSCAIM